jgi:hypothetical protein
MLRNREEGKQTLPAPAEDDEKAAFLAAGELISFRHSCFAGTSHKSSDPGQAILQGVQQ